MIFVVLIVLCWLVFSAYWAVSAAAAKPTAEEQGWRGKLLHSLPVSLGAALLVLPPRLDPLALPLVPHSAGAEALGAALSVIGLAGAIWSRRALAGNWSMVVAFKEDHRLVEEGPYRYVRHPIYTSLSLMFLGSAIAAGHLAGFAGLLLIVAGFWIKLGQEETLLTRHFPDAYPDYARRVKALVPFVL
jgi:protein-S-isoprenylcysteine O-methyltransferase Ste14